MEYTTRRRTVQGEPRRRRAIRRSVKRPSSPAGDERASSGSAETAAPARNFTLSAEQQVRAAAAGPPAYIRRKRAIEDLRESILRALIEHCADATSRGADAAAYAGARAPARDVE